MTVFVTFMTVLVGPEVYVFVPGAMGLMRPKSRSILAFALSMGAPEPEDALPVVRRRRFWPGLMSHTCVGTHINTHIHTYTCQCALVCDVAGYSPQAGLGLACALLHAECGVQCDGAELTSTPRLALSLFAASYRSLSRCDVLSALA